MFKSILSKLGIRKEDKVEDTKPAPVPQTAAQFPKQAFLQDLNQVPRADRPTFPNQMPPPTKS